MSTILSSAPGTVVKLETGRAEIPFKITMSDDFPDGGAIITAAQISQGGNFQFLHTVQDFIYVYIFGDRIGQLTVEGIAFLSQCDSDNNGFEETLQYYNRNRIAIRGEPVRVGFGNIAFEAFLMQGNFEIRDAPATGSFARFNFTLNTFPDEKA